MKNISLVLGILLVMSGAAVAQVKPPVAIKDRALFDKMHWNFIDLTGWVLKENIKEQQEWYVKNGMVPVKADVDAVVDDSYANYVQERLGVYRLR